MSHLLFKNFAVLCSETLPSLTVQKRQWPQQAPSSLTAAVPCVGSARGSNPILPDRLRGPVGRRAGLNAGCIGALVLSASSGFLSSLAVHFMVHKGVCSVVTESTFGLS